MGIAYSEVYVPNVSGDSAETNRLLMQISSGHREAFNELFERHRGELRRAIQLRLDRRLAARVDASVFIVSRDVTTFFQKYR